MTKLEEILSSGSIPSEIIQKINKLDEGGKDALNSYYDETSEFYKNAQPMLLARRFIADPQKYATLYHYTTSDALEAILKAKTFLAGSINYMNDEKEIKHTINLSTSLLNKLGASEQEITQFKYNFIRAMSFFDVYLWSFTTNGSSMAMGRYGDVALGFNNQELQNILADNFTPRSFANGNMKNGDAFVFPLIVNYDKNFQLNYLFPIIKVILSCIRNMEIDPIDMSEILNSSLRSLYILSICFKRPEIWEEREIRFLILRITDDRTTNADVVLNGKPRIEVPLDFNCLRQVIIDRSWSGKEDEMRKLMDKYGFYKTNVSLTKLPY